MTKIDAARQMFALERDALEHYEARECNAALDTEVQRARLGRAEAMLREAERDA